MSGEQISAVRTRCRSLRAISGNNVPRFELNKMNIKPEEFFANVVYAGSHENAIIALQQGQVDAAFNCVKMLFPHKARLQVYQVAAVTEGTDAQATVSVRLEEDGRIVTGSSADTDTIVASVKAYVNALNKLIVRRQKTAPDADVKSVNYRDAG